MGHILGLIIHSNIGTSHAVESALKGSAAGHASCCQR